MRWGSASREHVVFAVCVAASSLAHVWLVRVPSVGGAARVARGVVATPPFELIIDAHVPSSVDRTGGERRERQRVAEQAVLPGGTKAPPRPDTGTRGRGGYAAVHEAAVNLADRDDHVTLSRELTSRIDRDQLQRLATQRHRASDDDRRASREPMNLVFLATGHGTLHERHPDAPTHPSRGALEAPAFAQLGTSSATALEPLRAAAGLGSAMTRSAMLSADTTHELPWYQVGLDGRVLGKAVPSPGVGIMRGAPGLDHRRSARVATGRPLVTQAAPSVAANDSGRPRDNIDSNQEVAAVVQSLVHASTAGGSPGHGEGGTQGDGAPGSGGKAGVGSHAEAMGDGPGAFLAQSASDPHLSAYRRSVMAKIYPLWEHAFPKSASLDGKQGRAIVAMTIYADGHVDDVRLARASGVPEFDDNVQSAVRRAAPFAAFPSTIPGPSMRWRITFDVNNPVVR